MECKGNNFACYRGCSLWKQVRNGKSTSLIEEHCLQMASLVVFLYPLYNKIDVLFQCVIGELMHCNVRLAQSVSCGSDKPKVQIRITDTRSNLLREVYAHISYVTYPKKSSRRSTNLLLHTGMYMKMKSGLLQWVNPRKCYNK